MGRVLNLELHLILHPERAWSVHAISRLSGLPEIDCSSVLLKHVFKNPPPFIQHTLSLPGYSRHATLQAAFARTGASFHLLIVQSLKHVALEYPLQTKKPVGTRGHATSSVRSFLLKFAHLNLGKRYYEACPELSAVRVIGFPKNHLCANSPLKKKKKKKVCLTFTPAINTPAVLLVPPVTEREGGARAIALCKRPKCSRSPLLASKIPVSDFPWGVPKPPAFPRTRVCVCVTLLRFVPFPASVSRSNRSSDF